MRKTTNIVLIAAMMLIAVSLNAMAGVKVAVLDTGCNMAYTRAISLIDGSISDQNGHGTLIASIIKEVAPNAELYVIKVLGADGRTVNEDALIAGIEWAIDQGVQIINMSLKARDSDRLHQAIRNAQSQGIIIIAAAGNQTSETAYPAKYSEVIAIGALDKNGSAMNNTAADAEVRMYCKGYTGTQAGTSISAAYATGYIAQQLTKADCINFEQIALLAK